MNNRWRRIAFLKYGIKLDENYKYAESIIDVKEVEPVKRSYNFKLYKSKGFRKGAKHYATKNRKRNGKC